MRLYGAMLTEEEKKSMKTKQEEINKKLEAAQAELKKFKISYSYDASGMYLPDIFPEKIIEAKTKDMAAFIYHTIFFTPISLEKIAHIKTYSPEFNVDSFEDFLKQEEWEKYWGTKIEELKD